MISIHFNLTHPSLLRPSGSKGLHWQLLTFQKEILGPVNVDIRSDELDYLKKSHTNIFLITSNQSIYHDK